MRVRVESEVFTGPVDVAEVFRLFDLFLRGNHVWEAEMTQAAEVGVFFGKHMPPLSQTLTSLAMKTGAASAWRPTEPPQVTVTATTLTDDLHDLTGPAILMVENNASDKAFLKAVAMVLDGDDLLTAIDQGLLDIRHGGGKHDAVRQANDHAERFRRTPRVALLLDSDRLYPGQETVCHRLAARARQAGVAVHVLEFRETENYVPNRVLAPNGRRRDSSEASRRLSALKELNDRQRAHFDMKNGFKSSSDGGVVVDTVQRDLYADVPRRTLVKLGTGFGSDLTGRMEESASQGRIKEVDLSSLGEGVVEELRRVLRMLRTIV
ncbi:hypothetical protein AB0M72_27370 [Nocardiopsis dassonvillei]|uniref:hypothetical protein n=1 Tax=Nocardiopsis dassonvillei TaxID=2014 RepID=UPI00200D916B|nr:hypothetical protein [Nocardiopsis dassonvillei]MCK9871904.1 hypothetical protein [Nocardiopsis dassonvillei]